MIFFKWFYSMLIIYLILMLTICWSDSKQLTKSNFNSNIRVKVNSDVNGLATEVANCLKNNSNKNENNSTIRIITTWGNCLKIITLKIFDDMMSSSEINLMDGVKLVKISKTSIKTSKDFSSLSEPFQYKNLIKFMQNNTRKYFDIENNVNSKNMDDNIIFPKDTWSGHILNKFLDILKMYTLNIKLMDTNVEDSSVIQTGRHRRRNNMMMAMMFGITAMGAIIVPVGFQLLSILGGKALLLAKMALLLASLNGLKKIASSGIHYGLYHVPEHPHAGGGYYDRTDPNRYQRGVENIN